MKTACCGGVGVGGKLTFLIGEWWSSLDPAVGSRVLTDDERKMAGLLQAIWPFNLAEQRSTRAWGAQGMSSMERAPLPDRTLAGRGGPASINV